MDEVVILLGEKPKEILQCVMSHGVPVRLTWQGRQGWIRVRGLLTEVGSDFFVLQFGPTKRSQPIFLAPAQTVGVSFQSAPGSGRDRFIFGTTVRAGEQTPVVASGHVYLAMPEEIEIVRNKSFLAVTLPSEVKVEAELWHRRHTSNASGTSSAQICQGWTARLLSLSAQNLQVSISDVQGPNLSNAALVGVRFSPASHETPVSFNAHVRAVVPRPDVECVLLEMEIIGLEASPEGRLTLQRLCNLVGRYRKMAQQLTGPAQPPVMSFAARSTLQQTSS